MFPWKTEVVDMLPRHERRRLEEIEGWINANDPEFARALTDDGSFRALFTLRSPIMLLALVSAGSAVVCLLLGEASGFLMASLLTAALMAARLWDIRTD